MYVWLLGLIYGSVQDRVRTHKTETIMFTHRARGEETLSPWSHVSPQLNVIKTLIRPIGTVIYMAFDLPQSTAVGRRSQCRQMYKVLPILLSRC